MKIPSSTYRLQFSPDFSFDDARQLVAYLRRLGVSHIYASPIFKSRKGSYHGYDVTDPRIINPDLGGQDAFDSLIDECRTAGIGWIQDIVPNHMALNADNPFLVDILENGPLSQYYTFYDIEWDHPYDALRGKILLPVLGNFFGKCLEHGELKLCFDNSGLFIAYYDHRLPLRIESYASVFGGCTDTLRDALGDNNPDLLKFLGVLYTVKNLPGVNDLKERSEQTGFVKMLLWEMYENSAPIREQCDRILSEFNGVNTLTDKWSLLDSVLKEQHFRLTFWKTATQELNYRRFFTINDLIAVRVEDQNIFETTHKLIIDLVGSGKIQGLRIDHIDGLHDPAAYCERLRGKAPDAYIVVEKILAHGEDLPEHWPVQGTTGYDFLNVVNRLFCSDDGRRAIDNTYSTITEDPRPYHELVADKKRLIIGQHMAGDIDNLALRLKKLAGQDRKGVDITMYGLRRALVEFLTFFPIYRTYATETGFTATDRRTLKNAIDAARRERADFVPELDFIESFLDLDNTGTTDHLSAERRKFIMRLQQFTGPLLAKGIEDTALYSYNRLVSLNEVGGHPDLFGIGVKEFHEFCQRRGRHAPHAMNATATHDTKRGEGTRARINVLSEMGIEWSQKIRQWRQINEHALTPDTDNEPMPVMNDEYLFYQTIIGSYPFGEIDLDAFRSRVEEYMIKAIREAKIHSSWIRPTEPYENALLRFVRTVLASDPGNPFLREFVPFQKKVAWYGMINSLAQTTLKMTVPGVPDFYQGTELWDFSLVDPDNRRPVDFQKRTRILDTFAGREQASSFVEELVATPQNGGIKMFLIQRLLLLRERLHHLFTGGKYLPLGTKGSHCDSIVAFCRLGTDGTVIVAVPRMTTSIVKDGHMPFSRSVWGDTTIEIPREIPNGGWTDCFTGARLTPSGGLLYAGDIINGFPVAVLEMTP